MSFRIRPSSPILAGGAVLLAVIGFAVAAPAMLASDAPPRGRDDLTGPRTVLLAPIVAAWPDAYTVTGTKSEPLYVEHIVSTREGDVFALSIDTIMQGDATGGRQVGAVRVDAEGRIQWLTGCSKTSCDDDRALRGFLSAALLLSADRRAALPETATLRMLGDIPLVCVEVDALYVVPSISGLDPCFSRRTGALLAHWSDLSRAFVGPTLSPADLTDEPTADQRPDRPARSSVEVPPLQSLHSSKGNPTMKIRSRALLGGAVLAVSSALLLTGCSTPATDSTDEPTDVIRVAALTPGNTNDGGFNQVVADALSQLEEEGLIEYEIRDQMADPATSEPVIADFASQGYDLIIGHGVELGDAIFSVAADFPDIAFTASGGADILEQYTDNVETWTYSTPQVGYLSGFIAGSSGASPVGRVEALELDFITATDAYFLKGLTAANPDAEALPVVYAGSFDDAEAAAQATSGLISQGAQLVYTTGDGIAAGVGAAATEAGIPTVGVSPAAGEAALANNLSTVDLDMYPIFKTWIEEVAAGEFGGAGVTSTLENGGLVYSQVNSVGEIDGEAINASIEDLIAGLQDGSITID